MSKLPQKTLEEIIRVVETWNVDKEPEYRAFKCGKCLKNITKAWHVWFNYKGYRCEVHLCKGCFKKLSKFTKEK